MAMFVLLLQHVAVRKGNNFIRVAVELVKFTEFKYKYS